MVNAGIEKTINLGYDNELLSKLAWYDSPMKSFFS
jgi:hypothetical protein